MRQMSNGETTIVNGRKMRMKTYTESKKSAKSFKRQDSKNRAYRNVNGVYQLFERV